MQMAELTPSTRGIIMDNAKFIGRIGALAVALGVGFAAMVPPGVSLPRTELRQEFDRLTSTCDSFSRSNGD